jgi:hypothetical protein
MCLQRRGKKCQPLSETHRESIRTVRIGKSHSLLTRQKMAETLPKLKGTLFHSPRTKQKIFETMRAVLVQRRSKNKTHTFLVSKK